MKNMLFVDGPLRGQGFNVPINSVNYKEGDFTYTFHKYTRNSVEYNIAYINKANATPNVIDSLFFDPKK